MLDATIATKIQDPPAPITAVEPLEGEILTPKSPQDDLAALAACIRKAHQGVYLATSNLIAHALAAGDALIKAKDKAGHGNWLAGSSASAT